jgi:hypothetical protein
MDLSTLVVIAHPPSLLERLDRTASIYPREPRPMPARPADLGLCRQVRYAVVIGGLAGRTRGRLR